MQSRIFILPQEVQKEAKRNKSYQSVINQNDPQNSFLIQFGRQ